MYSVVAGVHPYSYSIVCNPPSSPDLAYPSLLPPPPTSSNLPCPFLHHRARSAPRGSPSIGQMADIPSATGPEVRRSPRIARTPRRLPKDGNASAAAGVTSAFHRMSVEREDANSTLAGRLQLSSGNSTEPSVLSSGERVTEYPSMGVQAVEDADVEDIEKDESAATLQLEAKLFTFVNELKKLQLRNACGAWGLRQGGNKPLLALRVYRELIIRNKDGRDISTEVLRGNLPSFSNFLGLRRIGKPWLTPPGMQDIEVELLEAGDKLDVPDATQVGVQMRGGGTSFPITHDEEEAFIAEGAEAPDFNVSEFARLCVIIANDEIAREAFFKLGQEMTRSQLDAGVSRDNYWATIAERFNDPTIRPQYSFVGRVDEANASEIPPCVRLPSTLKSQYTDSKGKFTTFYKRWEQSGQNNGERFPEFLPKVRGRLSALSKRMYIMFTVCKLGTPYPDERLLEVSSKLMPREVGCDEGFPTLETVVEGEGRRQDISRDCSESFGRKRKRHSTGGLEEKVGTICQTLNSYVTESRKSQEVSNPLLTKWKHQDEMMKLLENAHDTTKRAKGEAPSDSKFPELAEKVYRLREKAVEEELEKMLQ